MINVIIGIIMVIGGLSGKLVLKGTQSGGALAAIGGILIVFGIIRMVATKRQQ